MAIRVLAGAQINSLETGTVTLSAAADSLFPAELLWDGNPGQAFKAAATATSYQITVDGNRLNGGNFDTWSGSIPTGWGTTGTVAETVVAGEVVSGSAARLNGGASVYRDITVKAGGRYVIHGSRRILAAGQGAFRGRLQNRTTGAYWSGGTWSLPAGPFLTDTTNTTHTTYGPTAVTVEPFEDVGTDTCTLRLTLDNTDATATDYVFVDDWFFWPAVDFGGVFGHNVPSGIGISLHSSTDAFGAADTAHGFLGTALPAGYKLLSSVNTARHWRFDIDSGSGETFGPVWIGEAVIGQTTTLTRAQDYGQELRWLADNVPGNTPFGGTQVFKFGQLARRVLGLDFQFWTSAEFLEARRELFERSFGSANPLIVIPDDTAADVIMGRITDDWSVRQTLTQHFSDNSITVLESAFPVWTP